ncbi:MAG: methylenetetrahydrofolate reductase [Rikenellaceae bacterium]|nr:methylenetetrahydrofolate reductase [Rikenellaceae bacterium]
MKIFEILRQAEREGRTRFSFELLPPLKGETIGTIFDTIDALMPFDPACVNITYHRQDVKYIPCAGGLLERRVVRTRPGTVGISAAVAGRFGIEVVPHLICGGFSKYELEDLLIEMDFLGIENVLALRGDALKGENSFTPHPDGYNHASELVAHIARMNRGLYADAEIENCHSTCFSIGVAGYPEKHAQAPNPETDILHLKAKVDAGADYIVTQMFFDNAAYFRFIDACRTAGITVPVIPGLKPFSAKRQLTLLPEIFHVDLPADLVHAVETCTGSEDVRQTGIEWCVAQARELKAAGVPAIHFYTMGNSDNVVRIAKELF